MSEPKTCLSNQIASKLKCLDLLTTFAIDKSRDTRIASFQQIFLSFRSDSDDADGGYKIDKNLRFSGL